jgi:hypothetical protein
MRHPLEPFVLDLLQRRPHIDVAILAPELSGCTTFLGRRAATGNKAYRVVAEDVLGCMASDGTLQRTREGWYVLAKGQETP